MWQNTIVDNASAGEESYYPIELNNASYADQTSTDDRVATSIQGEPFLPDKRIMREHDLPLQVVGEVIQDLHLPR